LALLEPEGPSVELVQAYSRLCGMHMLARDFGAAELCARRAEAMTTDLGRPDHLSYLLVQGGVARLMSGRDEQARDLRRGIELARAQRLPETVLLGLGQLGSGAGEIRRYDLAVPALREAIEWAREHQMSDDYPIAWLSRCELDLGHWDAAGQLATRVLGGSQHSDIARFVASTVLGRLRARRGDP